MQDIVIRSAHDLIPGGLGQLKKAAGTEGIGIVTAVVDRWCRGEELYDRPGETLLVAVTPSGDAVAVGGLTVCPDVPGAMRVRRFYIHPDWRRNGLATRMASRLINHGSDWTRVITCNARASAAAVPFWESLGFVATTVPGITHVLRPPEAKLDATRCEAASCPVPLAIHYAKPTLSERIKLFGIKLYSGVRKR